MEQLQGEHLRTIAVSSEVVACNRKVTAEAFLEVYHFRPSLARGEEPCSTTGATMGLLPNGRSHGHANVVGVQDAGMRTGRTGST